MRLRSIALIISLALGILAASLSAEAQQAGKVPRIGLLRGGAGSFDPESNATDRAFAEGLSEHGWVVGRNILIEIRGAEGRIERLPELATQLVRLKVDVIVVPSTLGTMAVKRATATIPIVMVSVGDPVGSGFAGSLARPGGNITGLSDMNPDLSAKRVELLRAALPKLSRVAVLFNPAHPPNVIQLRETEAGGQALEVAVRSFKVRDPEEFTPAFAAITRDRAGAVIVLPDALTFAHRDLIADLALRNGLPMISGQPEYAVAGSLMSYGASLAGLFRRAATYVDKILKGAKPADLPVEQPTKFELVINLKTAKALGLTIPPSVMIRADHVIR